MLATLFFFGLSKLKMNYFASIVYDGITPWHDVMMRRHNMIEDILQKVSTLLLILINYRNKEETSS